MSSFTGAEPIPLADFETAIMAAGFGIYNMCLMVVVVITSISGVFVSSTISYVLPSAECDLRLTLMEKGCLNASVYAGMVVAAVFWGFVADTKGRKKILIFGYLADSVCGFGASISQNVWQLMLFKFLGGAISCGPFAVLMSYLTEMHGKNYRPRVMMIMGFSFSLGSLLLPTLAVLILPNKWKFNLFGLSFVSWQIFLAVCCLPSALSGLLLIFFPESPKFLMSQGRNDEAMKVFKTIFSINKHQPKEQFPIKNLVNELPSASNDCTIATIEKLTQNDSNLANEAETGQKHHKPTFKEGLQQLRPLFTKPFLGLSLRVYLMNFCILLGQNTVRLWLPQLFSSIIEYNKRFAATGASADMCHVLEYNVNKTASIAHLEFANKSCDEPEITAATYQNNIIVATCGVVGYAVAGLLVNIIGVKRILILGLVIAGTCGASLYWSTSSLYTLISASLYVTAGSISSTSVISSSANLFPTALRTMIVSITMMTGRSGSLIGNILFPTLITLGCMPPFLMISAVMLLGALFACFIPDSQKMALK